MEHLILHCMVFPTSKSPPPNLQGFSAAYLVHPHLGMEVTGKTEGSMNCLILKILSLKHKIHLEEVELKPVEFMTSRFG
jgi:hypothetical protein